MKTRTLALCATAALATASSVRAETRNDAVILCTVRLACPSPSGYGYLSVSIPDSVATGTEVGPVKLWNLGIVAAGGVYDSFYNGGPGYFRVQNTGTLPAYVYVSTGSDCEIRREGHGWPAGDSTFEGIARTNVADHAWQDLSFNPWIQGWDLEEKSAKLAVSTDVTGIVPNWRPLSYFHDMHYTGLDTGWFDGSKVIYQSGGLSYGGQMVSPDSNEVSAFLAFMPVGETQLFDLKFWAPYVTPTVDCYFVVCVHASAVRLWDNE